MNLLKSELTTHGVTHHGIKYSVPGKRRSGDPTTSEGNSFLNGAMLLYSLNATNAYASVVNARNIPVVLQKLGMVPTPIYHDTPTTVSFCSSYFLPCEINGTANLVLTPKLGRVLSKSHWNFTDLHDGEWANAVAFNQCIDFSHLPIYRDLAQVLLRCTSATPKRKRMDDVHNFHLDRPVGQSPLIYYYLDAIYGISATEVDALAATIRSVQQLPAVLSGPTIERIVDVDVQPEPPLGPAPNAFHDHHIHAPVGAIAPALLSFLKQWVHVVIAAPIYEEAIKRIGRKSKHALIWTEFVLYTVPHIGTPLLPVIVGLRLAVAGMHYAAARLSYPAGILMHMGWNFLAMLGPLFAALDAGTNQ
jgi:hypothetical protein